MKKFFITTVIMLLHFFTIVGFAQALESPFAGEKDYNFNPIKTYSLLQKQSCVVKNTTVSLYVKNDGILVAILQGPPPACAKEKISFPEITELKVSQKDGFARLLILSSGFEWFTLELNDQRSISRASAFARDMKHKYRVNVVFE